MTHSTPPNDPVDASCDIRFEIVDARPLDADEIDALARMIADWLLQSSLPEKSHTDGEKV